MGDVGFAFKKRMFAIVGVVDHLIRYRDLARPHVDGDAAYRIDGQHPGDANGAQGPDIGAVIDLVRRNRVAVAVTRQEDHFSLGDFSEGEMPGRLAERRTYHLPASNFKIGEIG